MTEREATSFARVSALNAARVRSVFHCGCEPYVDTFTFGRWLAQGYAVQKGQHGVSLPIVREENEENDDGDTVKAHKVLARAWVFCRHQVAPAKGVRGDAARTQSDKAAEAKAARTPNATGIVRPPVKAKGAAARRARFLTNGQLEKLAKQEGANPYKADWYDGIDSVAVADMMEQWKAV